MLPSRDAAQLQAQGRRPFLWSLECYVRSSTKSLHREEVAMRHIVLYGDGSAMRMKGIDSEYEILTHRIKNDMLHALKLKPFDDLMLTSELRSLTTEFRKS